MTKESPNPADLIPNTQLIRARLSQITREAGLLRSLLKLADRVETNRKNNEAIMRRAGAVQS